MRWTWRLRRIGEGTEVEQEWRLLRADPVLGDTLAELTALRDYMISSVETTLVALAGWISERGRRPARSDTAARAARTG
ncbi:hypothetical protein [Crossiella cryophila]|uniref:Uncharacterized protein n=1 Tax=Crossiella cryophila TaxID=43355 RepID=A0A7W7CF29_9PSEU|nr:hypothetical protein [Crossiella cryophila]MBB4680052.1 hypothetical protein [Crossiella cryophila]